jgi:mRNA interferase MazF
MRWSLVTIVPTSTSAQPAVFRPAVDIDGEQTRFLVDQIRSIDTDYLIGDPVHYLERHELAEVEHAVASYLGL